MKLFYVPVRDDEERSTHTKSRQSVLYRLFGSSV